MNQDYLHKYHFGLLCHHQLPQPDPSQVCQNCLLKRIPQTYKRLTFLHVNLKKMTFTVGGQVFNQTYPTFEPCCLSTRSIKWLQTLRSHIHCSFMHSFWFCIFHLHVSTSIHSRRTRGLGSSFPSLGCWFKFKGHVIHLILTQNIINLLILGLCSSIQVPLWCILGFISILEYSSFSCSVLTNLRPLWAWNFIKSSYWARTTLLCN